MFAYGQYIISLLAILQWILIMLRQVCKLLSLTLLLLGQLFLALKD